MSTLIYDRPRRVLGEETTMNRREFLSATGAIGIGLGLRGGNKAFAQSKGAVPHRQVKTTRLFKAPALYPNGLAISPEGLWIAQQKISAAQAALWHEPVPADRKEAAWLVDWQGKLLKTVMTGSRNTSGMAYGDGCVWMGANADMEGFFQVDMNSSLVRHLQIPLGPAGDGGGCHGAQWHEGKLWIVANRLRGILRVDPKTWQPEFMIPIHTTPDLQRWHDITFDNHGFLWQINGNDSTSFQQGRPGLVKYDATTGQVLETAEFLPGSCDPHGLENHDGVLISCDAGCHPGWPDKESPSSGYIFRIDFV
jgi:hypothetical protein